MLFIILFVLPFVALILLVIAVVRGFKSKNPKRYFIVLGSIAGVIALWISSLFVDYESFIVNAVTSTKTPEKYRDYHYLQDTITPNYSIKRLQGGAIQQMFTDTETSDLIVVTEKDHYYSYFYHRIDTSGQLIGPFSLPDNIHQRGPYFIGSHAYCDWITSGDTICKPYTPIKETLNRETLRAWYQAADCVEFFSDSICVLHKDNIWYSCKVDFRPEYFSPEEYLEKAPYLIEDLREERAYKFAGIPQKINNDLLLEHFCKEEYRSGFSRFLSGIGSPTGGRSADPRWIGTGYFELHLGNKYIPFTSTVVKRDEEYEIELSLYKRNNYAILSKKHRAYLINIR